MALDVNTYTYAPAPTHPQKRGQEHLYRNATLKSTETTSRFISTLFSPSHRRRRDKETSEAQNPYRTIETLDILMK